MFSVFDQKKGWPGSSSKYTTRYCRLIARVGVNCLFLALSAMIHPGSCKEGLTERLEEASRITSSPGFDYFQIILRTPHSMFSEQPTKPMKLRNLWNLQLLRLINLLNYETYETFQNMKLLKSMKPMKPLNPWNLLILSLLTFRRMSSN